MLLSSLWTLGFRRVCRATRDRIPRSVDLRVPCGVYAGAPLRLQSLLGACFALPLQPFPSCTLAIVLSYLCFLVVGLGNSYTLQYRGLDDYLHYG